MNSIYPPHDNYVYYCERNKIQNPSYYHQVAQQFPPGAIQQQHIIQQQQQQSSQQQQSQQAYYNPSNTATTTSAIKPQYTYQTSSYQPNPITSQPPLQTIKYQQTYPLYNPYQYSDSAAGAVGAAASAASSASASDASNQESSRHHLYKANHSNAPSQHQPISTATHLKQLAPIKESVIDINSDNIFNNHVSAPVKKTTNMAAGSSGSAAGAKKPGEHPKSVSLESWNFNGESTSKIYAALNRRADFHKSSASSRIIFVKKVFNWLAAHDPDYLKSNKTEELVSAISDIINMIISLIELHRAPSFVLYLIILASDRFVARTGINHHQIFNLLLTSSIVNLKFWNESLYIQNKTIADIFSFNVKDLNTMERRFLYGLDYNLCVSEEQLRKYIEQIKCQNISSMFDANDKK
ncbi:hypothetical protein SAMD00019534_005460 [Acytostelium subglobosum LB1]|uniref:hypothetical protein n=1 Tax=Acytostelium subglobosum LB1 TaxID=1410327 RepID=UPI000644E57C|nr:hypothetical protein SAMD00019534_005460 [Acytostelium subglobosum LB1]GAM17371.1 hypothetical protein SAMD00019534_005460 [Acytostelium subglobosum LB1]|eukprot:XP_012759433.1 hypothetical protein SAMD00019534_005460 [Acytostelium subglobosum LB1]